jgi:hypothetical protein
MEYWTEISNQKRYIEWLAEQHSIRSPEEWYNVTVTNKTFYEILKLYDNSLAALFSALFPEHKWYRWLFKQVQY